MSTNASHRFRDKSVTSKISPLQIPAILQRHTFLLRQEGARKHLYTEADNPRTKERYSQTAVPPSLKIAKAFLTQVNNSNTSATPRKLEPERVSVTVILRSFRFCAASI